MQRVLSALGLFLLASLPAVAEEIVLKDGTKIVGHMTSLSSDKIEVTTNYGKMQVKRTDIMTISFPENGAPNAPAAAAPAKADAPNIDESLHGTQYVNKTGKFSLTLPADWIINTDLTRSASVLTGLSSRDKMRFLMVAQEDYTGSLESYKDLNQLHARRSLGNFEELAESPTVIDGKSALLVTYRGTLPKGDNLPVQFLIAIIPSGTTFTKLSAWCVEPLFHETQATFEKILTSYHSGGQPSLSSASSSKP